MKRQVVFVIMLALILTGMSTLTGCGTQAGNTSTNNGVEPAKSNAASAPKDGKTDSGAKGTVAKIKERGKIVVGVKYDSALFGYKDPTSGELRGFDIDMSKVFAKKLLGDEKKIEFKEVTSKTRVPLLESGDIDAVIATMTITEDRKQVVDFSDPYVVAGQSLLVHKDSKVSGLSDLKGKTVIAVKGATSGKNVKDRQPDTKVVEYENYSEAFTALKTGKGDALTTDNFNLMGLKKQDPNYKLVGETFSDEPYGIAVKKGDAELLKVVNDFVKEFKASPDYATIYEKAMGEKPPVKK